jgi:hypothetical protein
VDKKAGVKYMKTQPYYQIIMLDTSEKKKKKKKKN